MGYSVCCCCDPGKGKYSDSANPELRSGRCIPSMKADENRHMASLCRLFIERVDDVILEARAGGLVEGRA